MQRYHSSEISAGVGDLLRRVIHPTTDGWWDVSPIRLEPNHRNLHEPYISAGDKRVAVSINELSRAAGYLPLRYAEHSRMVSWILLMADGWVQVFWDRGGICLFERVEDRHREVLRVIHNSLSNGDERKHIGASFKDTVLSLADYYGCQGEHKGRCPRDECRERSIIDANGNVDMRLLKSLRDLGVSSDY
jgi:hypothetical protein